MRKKNLLAGLLLLPLGATAGLFWWLQKDKDQFPEKLASHNNHFWNSAAPDADNLREMPVFGVRIYGGELPRAGEGVRDSVVTILSDDLNKGSADAIYGHNLAYNAENPGKLSSELLDMIPQFRIINVQEDNPWLKTPEFKRFVFDSTMKYLLYYGAFKKYPQIRLDDTIAEWFCPALAEYLENPRKQPQAFDGCLSMERRFNIRQRIIPLLQKIDSAPAPELE